MNGVEARQLHPIFLADPLRGRTVGIEKSGEAHFDPGVIDGAAGGREGGAEAPRAGAGAFHRILGQRMASEQSPEQVRRDVYRHVEELLAQTLVAPVLAKLGDDPLNSGLFERGHAEKALRPLLEAEVAKDIVAGMRAGFVEHVARGLLRHLPSAPPAHVNAGGASFEGSNHA